MEAGTSYCVMAKFLVWQLKEDPTARSAIGGTNCIELQKMARKTAKIEQKSNQIRGQK